MPVRPARPGDAGSVRGPVRAIDALCIACFGGPPGPVPDGPAPRRPPIACGDVGTGGCRTWRGCPPGRARRGARSGRCAARWHGRSPTGVGARRTRGRAPTRFAGGTARRRGSDRLRFHARASRHEGQAPRVRPGPEETRRGTRAGHDHRSTREHPHPLSGPPAFARTVARPEPSFAGGPAWGYSAPAGVRAVPGRPAPQPHGVGRGDPRETDQTRPIQQRGPVRGIAQQRGYGVAEVNGQDEHEAGDEHPIEARIAQAVSHRRTMARATPPAQGRPPGRGAGRPGRRATPGASCRGEDIV